MGEQRNFRAITANGKKFIIPKTQDMISSVFRPKEVNSFDLVTLSILGIQIAGFFYGMPKWYFIAVFMFWRLAYNVGLGYILKMQSDHKWLFLLAKQYSLFDSVKANPVQKFLKKQLLKKMGDDYVYEDAPLELNVWLLFRATVDIVLTNDFTAFVILTLSHTDYSLSSWYDIFRFVFGSFLLAVNVWVKLDAHRVVGDFAWFWADFFFLLDNPTLCFDGVYDVAPHPMYSIGYIGMYGASLMSKSYTVLYISLIAHTLQFIFLAVVENPHINKIYGPEDFKKQFLTSNPHLYPIMRTYFQRDLIVFKNFDIFRSHDLALVLLIMYSIIIGLLSYKMAVAQAILWIILHTYGTGLVLSLQSADKLWTKHFIKNGFSNKEAFDNWKKMYNASLCLMNVSFAVAAFKYYTFPEQWTYGFSAFQHVVGILLILLQGYVSMSVYEVLGEFGWFFGDFFLETVPNQLTYTGIYRYMNNPDRILGNAGFWGITVICNNWVIFAITVFTYLSNNIVLQYVENPHMHVLYGNFIRKESGVEKTLKKVLPPLSKFLEIFEKERHLNRTQQPVPLRKMSDLVDKAAPAIRGVLDKVEEKIDNAQIRRSSSFDEIALNKSSLSEYKISLNKSTFLLGEAIHAEYWVPKDHGMYDWIAIYKANTNIEEIKNIEVSKASSKGCWVYLWGNQSYENEYLGGDINTHDTVVFGVNMMLFEAGEYEVRVHYHNSHRVVAKSLPFTVECPTINLNQLLETQDYDSVVSSVSDALILYVQNILEKPNLRQKDDLILVGDLQEKQAKRICIVIDKVFGVDISFRAIGEVLDSVDSVAEKICEYVVEVGLRSSIVTRSRSRSPSRNTVAK